jgi:hypothetical protein
VALEASAEKSTLELEDGLIAEYRTVIHGQAVWVRRFGSSVSRRRPRPLPFHIQQDKHGSGCSFWVSERAGFNELMLPCGYFALDKLPELSPYMIEPKEFGPYARLDMDGISRPYASTETLRRIAYLERAAKQRRKSLLIRSKQLAKQHADAFDRRVLAALTVLGSPASVTKTSRRKR